MQVILEGIWERFNNLAIIPYKDVSSAVISYAIYTSANNSYGLAGNDLKNILSGMFFEKAPQGQTYPYGVYHLTSNRPNWTYTEDMRNFIIDFNLYDNSSSSTNINSAYEELKKLYDWTTLSVTGWSSIYMKRELDNLTRDNDIWNYFVQYRLEIQK